MLTKNTGSSFKRKIEIFALCCKTKDRNCITIAEAFGSSKLCPQIHAASPIHTALFSSDDLRLTCCPSSLLPQCLYHKHISLFKSVFPWALRTLRGPKANCSFLSPLLSAAYQTLSPIGLHISFCLCL